MNNQAPKRCEIVSVAIRIAPSLNHKRQIHLGIEEVCCNHGQAEGNAAGETSQNDNGLSYRHE